MCKRKSYQIDRAALAVEGAYEGQTMRLDRDDNHLDERRDRPVHRHIGRFPWWTLWLIWPLIGLAKWFVPLYMGAVAAGLARLSAAGIAPFVAIVLIVIGFVLIGRRQ